MYIYTYIYIYNNCIYTILNLGASIVEVFTIASITISLPKAMPCSNITNCVFPQMPDPDGYCYGTSLKAYMYLFSLSGKDKVVLVKVVS